MCHIISQSFSEGIEWGSKQHATRLDHFSRTSYLNYFHFSGFNWAKTADALVERFGGFSVLDLLGSGNIRNPLNALAFSALVHRLFDEFGVWLMRLRITGQLLRLDCRIMKVLTSTRLIVLTYSNDNSSPLRLFGPARSRTARKIEPPSPQLITLRAACVRVVHISGAALDIQGHGGYHSYNCHF